MSDPEDRQAMTTNERLFAAGLFGEYDRALREGDAGRVRAILEHIGVDMPSIELIMQRVQSSTGG
jgi:hypothetical protein